MAHATEYYKMLFGHGEGDRISLDAGVWGIDEKLSPDEAESLDKPFSVKELKMHLI